MAFAHGWRRRRGVTCCGDAARRVGSASRSRSRRNNPAEAWTEGTAFRRVPVSVVGVSIFTSSRLGGASTAPS